MNLRLSSGRLFLALFALVSAPLASPHAHAATGDGKDGMLECAFLRPIAQGFLAHHIEARKLDEEHERRAIEQFITRLDPSKIYLLQSDVTQIQNEMKGISGKLGESCSPIEKAHQILVNRLSEAAVFSKKVLDNDYKFAENTELTVDAKQRKHPSSKEEAQAQLTKFIHFQISNYLASDMKLPQARKQLIHRYELNAKRQADIKRDEVYSMFLDSFASGLDAHSSYLSRDTLEDFEIQMRLSLEGIGAALTWEDGYTTVESLIPGGSAEKSGELQPKDKIMAVAQGTGSFEPVIDMPLRDVVKLIRGKKGTTVRLRVLRAGAAEGSSKIVALKRDKINLSDEEAKLRYTSKKVGDKTQKIALIELPSFYGDLTRRTRSCYDDVKKLVDQAVKDKADGIVFDLSKNGGGLLTEAVKIAGIFIKKGNVVATQNSKNRMEMLTDDDETLDYAGPMVVLTSRLSASASEIVAGALQDYHRAVIVGADHTFGKGTVQAMMNLPTNFGGGAIKVTTGMFFIPGGESTQYRGVPADVTLPSLFATKEVGEESLDYSLKHRSVPIFTSKEANGATAPNWTPVSEDMIKKLQVLSATRVEKDKDFKKIKEELVELEKRKGVINLADSLKKQKAEKKDSDKDKGNSKKQARRGKHLTDEEYIKAAQVTEAVSVLSDMIQLGAGGNRTAQTNH